MSDKKLRSDEVPQKFAEWLLAMGCPPEIVPSTDKVAEMCRGQYYMVWRSLMEKVEPKDTVRTKRLQVFADDVQKCQKINVFNEMDTNVVMPEELAQWKQQTQLQDKVRDSELRVLKEKNNLHQIMDKISSKLSHRSLLRKRVQDASRRAWLLQQVNEQLKEKKANLIETNSIAVSLCGLDEGDDVHDKLDKYMNSLCSQRAFSANTSEIEDEQTSSLIKSRGDALMEAIQSRRAALCNDLTAPITPVEKNDSVTLRSVLAQTASLHCNLTLEAVKNRVHIKTTSEKFLAAVNELSKCLSNESCEVLVSRVEVSSRAARLHTLRTAAGLLNNNTHTHNHAHTAAQLDADIVSKRDELEKLISTAAVIEKKTINVRDCLTALFSGFHDDSGTERFEGRSSLPQDTVSILRQFFYDSRNKQKLQLSMDLDASDSFFDAENGNPKFTDELKLYLKKFNLENNRNFVLDSGEKIWTFETTSSSLERIRSKWQLDDVTTSLLCPSVSLKHNIDRISIQAARKAELERMAKHLQTEKCENKCIDITKHKEDEQKTLDKIKRRLNDDIQSLQKTNKSLDIGIENLQFWSNNRMKNYISDKRNIEEKCYKECERLYLEYLSL